MSHQAYRLKLAAIDALRFTAESDARATQEQLRKALKDRNNHVVARAASVCRELQLVELIPDLRQAFDRFFADAVRSDPQCLAKSELASTLRDLGHHDAAAYVRGITHVQLEPTWGGRADSAAALRGTCALALSECPIDDFEILTYLVDALADADRGVRVDAVRAIEQLNRPEGALVLRLKLLLGDAESIVMGQCFQSMLSLAPETGVSFIGHFLKSDNPDVQLEAASALAESRDARAIGLLREFWNEPQVRADIRQALLVSLGASPRPESIDFLLEVVRREAFGMAITAVTAISNSRFHLEARQRLEGVLAERDSYELHSLFSQLFDADSA